MDIDEPVDEVETDDQNNDIISGCYVLDIDLGLEYEKIWVRAEYIRVYEYLEDYYEKTCARANNVAPGAVITGNPGIGESIPSRIHSLRY